MTGTIVQLHRDRGVGTLLGADSKSYTFRRSDVHDVWFHDGRGNYRLRAWQDLSATRVRPVSASV